MRITVVLRDDGQAALQIDDGPVRLFGDLDDAIEAALEAAGEGPEFERVQRSVAHAHERGALSA